jgi:hypothetical protein
MIDVNVSLSRWPFRRLPLDEAERLVAALKQRGITQAWSCSFDGLLHRDIAAVNLRIANDCRTHGLGLLVPFGTVNPTLPDWPEDLRRCQDEHRMPGIRLYPNYHGYRLSAACCAQLLDEAARRSVLVQIAVGMDDERTQHPLMRVPVVNLEPLVDLLAQRPALRVVLLNVNVRIGRDPLIKILLDTGRVWLDTAMLEGISVVERFVESYGAGRLLAGSHAPFYCLDAPALKLQESALADADHAAIAEGNASALLSRFNRRLTPDAGRNPG